MRGAGVRCRLVGHEWRAIHNGPFGYLTEDEDGHTHQCRRCRTRGKVEYEHAHKSYVEWVAQLRASERRLQARIAEQRKEIARLQKDARDQRAWMRGLGFETERQLRREIARLRSAIEQATYHSDKSKRLRGEREIRVQVKDGEYIVGDLESEFARTNDAEMALPYVHDLLVGPGTGTDDEHFTRVSTEPDEMRCPVCKGKGTDTVQSTRGPLATDEVPCHACGGKGYR